MLMELSFTPSKLPKKGERFKGEADGGLLIEIAYQLKILRVDELRWELVAKPWGKKGFRLDGIVKAIVAQACIVTLAPVIEQIEETVDLRFVPEETNSEKPRKTGLEEDINFDAMPEDEPETYAGDEFDAMPFVIEHLALGLDPYPRAKGAAFADYEPAPQETSALTRALEAWTNKKTT
jgi:Large ribosomal RNA subunit accumulation protein YceD